MNMSQTTTRPAASQSTAAPERPRRTNRMAIWALALAILTLGGVGSVLGIVLGAKARQRVQQTGEGGARLATAAIVVGVVTALVAIAYWVVIARHFGGSSGGGGGTGGGGGGGGGY
jgi:uncharacterized membrane protein YgcG